MAKGGTPGRSGGIHRIPVEEALTVGTKMAVDAVNQEYPPEMADASVDGRKANKFELAAGTRLQHPISVRFLLKETS